MMKRGPAFTDSGDSSDGKGSGSDGSDLDKEMLSLAKKNKNKAPAPKKLKPAYSHSDSSDSGSDWGSKSKGKKSKRKKSTGGRKSSIRRSISTPSSSDDDDDDHRSEVTKDTGAMGNSSAFQPSTKIKEEDLEEGEVDDSGDSSDSSEFNDGYDDNLMGDEEDRKRLNSMTEKEREQELYKRIEQREVMKTRFDIEKKLRQANRKANKKKKKADASSIVSSKFSKTDAKERSKERKKTVEAKVDKKSQAMDMLKAKREAKKEREEEKEKLRVEKEMNRRDDDFDDKDDLDTKSTVTERTGPRRKLKTEDIYSDDSASDWENSSTVNAKVKRESSSDSSDSDAEERPNSVTYVETVADLNRIRLTRTKIEKWVHCPFFKQVAKGCFVRIGIGFNAALPVYQVAEVLEAVETSRVYNLGNTRTNKGFRLRHGSYEKVFRLEYVSQQDFAENEFKRWKDVCETSSILRPTLEEIAQKEIELAEAANYEFKEEDIEKIITEKQKFKKCPVNFAVKKTQLMKEKENAIQRGEEEKAEELSREIADLDDRAKELDKERSKSISSIGYINQRNRKKNVEAAEKAIMEEVRANKGKKVEDPFTRRNTKPMIVHRPLGFQDALDGAVAANAALEVKVEETVEPLELDEKEVNSNDSNAEDAKKILDDLNLDDDEFSLDILKTDIKSDKKMTVNDLFQAHDFDIKLELDEKVVLPNLPIVARSIIPPQVRDVGPRRSLNLEDYKRKRGLI